MDSASSVSNQSLVTWISNFCKLANNAPSPQGCQQLLSYFQTSDLQLIAGSQAIETWPVKRTMRQAGLCHFRWLLHLGEQQQLRSYSSVVETGFNQD
jgi:hypothetical protein